MRIFILILFALAFGKIGTHAYIHHDAAKRTIINAYREHALAACHDHIAGAGGVAQRRTDRGSQSYRPVHDANVSFDLMIGNRSIDVRLWQTSHSRWSARYRDPFILVRLHGPNGAAVCEYDINNARAHARTTAGQHHNG